MLISFRTIDDYDKTNLSNLYEFYFQNSNLINNSYQKNRNLCKRIDPAMCISYKVTQEIPPLSYNDYRRQILRQIIVQCNIMNQAQFQEFHTSLHTPDFFRRKVNRQVVAGFSTFQICYKVIQN